MNRFYLTAATPFALVVMVMAVRLLIPFNVTESEYATPRVHSFAARENGAGDLESILAHNLFDESRQPLDLPEADEAGEAGGPLSADGPNPDNKEGGGAIRLVGVSFTRDDPFVVIESPEGAERYEAGDLLPDGATLKAIYDYGILVSDSEHSERYYLFGK